MESYFPALNLKAKLIVLMVGLLTLTLGAEVWVSLGTQAAIVADTQEKVKDLARVIQIGVQELTAVRDTDRDQLHNYVDNLHTQGLEVSIASSENLILNSSNPQLIGAALRPKQAEWLTPEQLKHPDKLVTVPPGELGLAPETTVYLIPVEVEDHLLGYVQVVANFGDFAQPLEESRTRELMIAFAIFAIGLVFAYILADRYVKPIHAVANAAQNIAARGLEPVPEAHRRDEIGLLTRSFNDMVGQLRRAREREQELNRLERFTALGQLAGGLAHEIKNPLNFISLALDQLRARYAPQQANDREAFLRQLSIMKDEMRRLADLVQSFLHYGKPIEIFPAPTDVLQLVDEVVALSESKMKSQGIELVEECDGDAGAERRCGEAAHLLYQRGRQRDPGDAGRRHDADKFSAGGGRRIDGDQFFGHRRGDRSGRRGACVRAVLHDQARRNRARAVPVEGDRRDAWGYNRYRTECGRARDHIDFHLSAERGGKRTQS